MKIIEAMKRVKLNEEKIVDLQAKIKQYCVHLNIEKPAYKDQHARVKEWLQSCTDLTQENVRLLCAIQRTNLETPVTIELGGKSVTKTIAEWVWRRRKYAEIDRQTWSGLSDRGLKEGISQSPTGGQVEMTLVRYFDPVERDNRVLMYREEPGLIDSTLEVVNATTDLLEE